MVDGPPSGTERRRSPRHELLAQVRVTRGRTDIVMELVNISRSGALIDMGSVKQPNWVDVGRVLDIAITHPISFDLVDVSGREARISKDEHGTRFAVEFGEVSQDTTRRIGELVLLARESEAPPPTSPRAGGPPPLPEG